MSGRPDGGVGDRHRILRILRSELERHPIVTAAVGHPPALFREIQAELAVDRWDYPATDATLRVTWYPGDPSMFTFHYRDETGFDCGWHHEPNPRVDGWAHYQARERPDAAYAYEPIAFEADTPTTLVWEILDRLRKRLDERP